MLTATMDRLISELDDTDLIDLLSRVASEQRRRQRQRRAAEAKCHLGTVEGGASQ
jgi:DNA-binding TFAR19-related protein (PDSD5 family)